MKKQIGTRFIWSIPIYNKGGYFVNNAIDRFTINSFMAEQGLLHVIVLLYLTQVILYDLKNCLSKLLAVKLIYKSNRIGSTR